jgi:hypothetical protein
MTGPVIACGDDGDGDRFPIVEVELIKLISTLLPILRAGGLPWVVAVTLPSALLSVKVTAFRCSGDIDCVEVKNVLDVSL